MNNSMEQSHLPDGEEPKEDVAAESPKKAGESPQTLTQGQVQARDSKITERTVLHESIQSKMNEEVNEEVKDNENNCLASQLSKTESA